MSCNKEEFVTKHSPISIAVSKSLVYNWIQNSKNNTNNFKLSQRSDTVMIDSLVKEIQWDKAVSYYDEIKLQYVIEVPIIQKIDYAYMIPWNGLSYHPTTYEQKNKRSLIIVQDDSLNIHIAICNILGSSEYFQSGKTNESNNYQFKDTSYSGYVVYTDWNDNILEGYEFEHGMPTGWCINVNGTLDTIPKAKVRWKDCKFVFTWSWYEFIQDYTKKDCKCGHFVGRGELLLEIICYNMPRSSRGGGFSGNFGGNGGYPTIPGRGYRGGNGGGENPTNPDTRTWIQVKLEKAYECIGGAGIKGIMAEVALKEKAKNLCGKSYEELLLQAYDNMIEQGKDCSDINAVNDMLKDLEAMIDANFSQAMKTFRSKYGTLNMNEKEFLNFVNTSPCLDFCSNEAELEKCLIKNFAGLTDEEWELLNLKLNKVEKDWIYQNSWAMKYLIKYIKNCGGNSDPSRPDLGILGNIIRSYLDSDVSKDYFDRYWLGQGDLILNIDQFNEIYDETLVRGKIEDTFEEVIYKGQSARKHGARINSGKHLLSIGGYTLYKDLNSLPIGLYDYYDFNWHLGVLIPVDFDGDKTVYDNLLTTIAGCTDRTFLSEWKTRAVNVASLFSSARPYKIGY